MVVYTWHDDFMSKLVKVLEFAQAGQPVSDKVFSSLTPQEQTAVRAFENARQVEHRWRDITVSILHTATDLSRGQDRMKVLKQLVHSSRSIIRSDVAYISLNNPKQGSTQVLATSGIITEKFRNVLVPLGVGITGNVAATKQPAWTFDHRQDPKVTHVPHIDDAVLAEGLHGFLGAPLVSSGEVIGALMVGDRRPRYYTADEIIILDSLASLASVALETSQLIEDLEENLTALRKAHVQSEQQVEQLKALYEADDQLMDVLANGAHTSEVREVIRGKLDCEAWFWRDDQPYPARKDEIVDITHEALGQMQELIAESQNIGGIARGEEMSALAISLNGRHLGAICVSRVVDDSQGLILHRASQTLATIILSREAVLEAESRRVDDLLRKVVMGAAVEEDISRIRKMTGVNLRDNSKFKLVVCKASGSLPNARILNQLLGEIGLLFEHRDHLCAVVKTPVDIENSLQVLFEWANENDERLFIGAAPLPSAGTEIIDAHLRANSLATSMQTLGLPNQVATASTFGSLGLLLSAGSEVVDQIISDGIGALLSYDKTHGTDLTATAAQYFDSSRSVASAAKALYIHENTVRQRIDRITQILGPRWNSDAQSFDTHLALRAWRIAGSS